MEGLKKILSGEIVPSLNLELIVKECFNTTDPIQKSKRYLHVITSIKKGIINPNDLLVIGIGEISKLEDLSLIALLLRHGANVNMYVNTNNLGVAHVIIFTVFIKIPPSGYLLFTYYFFLEKIFETKIGLHESMLIAKMFFWSRSKSHQNLIRSCWSSSVVTLSLRTLSKKFFSQGGL